MQHQSQNLTMRLTAGDTGLPVTRPITGAEIERHIAAGKRMQAEAIAAGLKWALRGLGLLFRRPPAPAQETALPHRA